MTARISPRTTSRLSGQFWRGLRVLTLGALLGTSWAGQGFAFPLDSHGGPERPRSFATERYEPKAPPLVSQAGDHYPKLAAWYGDGGPSLSLENRFEARLTLPIRGDARLESGKGSGKALFGVWELMFQLVEINPFERLTNTLRQVTYEDTMQASLERHHDLKRTGRENLTTSRVRNAYASNGLYLTRVDSVWEVNASTSYALTDSVTLGMDMGVMKLHLDPSLWGSQDVKRDAFAMEMTVHYAF